LLFVRLSVILPSGFQQAVIFAASVAWVQGEKLIEATMGLVLDSTELNYYVFINYTISSNFWARGMIQAVATKHSLTEVLHGNGRR
jgi:hypothetical protein